MGIDLYKGFRNKVTGESFRCLHSDRWAFRFEWIVEQGGYIPFEHIHLEQDERFTVTEGSLRIFINGGMHIIRKGQTITVPKGARHIAHNNGPGRLICEVEYLPGLDQYQFFQCFGGLTMDGELSKNGTIHIGKMLYFTRKMQAKCLTRPTKIPSLMFKLAIQLSYARGSVLGWERQYRKYIGENKKANYKL